MPFNKSNYLDRFEKLKLQIGKDFDQLNFIHPSVEKVATQPEGSPTDGLRYIVGEASDGYGEGAFSECPKNYIAEYDSRLKSWTFFKPYVGMEVIDKTARYLKKYTGTQWTNYMSFSVSDSAEEADIAQYANTAGALANYITFSLTGAVSGVTDPAVNLSLPVTIPTTLNFSSNSSISGILPIEKGGTGNTSGLASGLDHSLAIVLSGGVQSSLDWANVGPDNEDFSPNLTSNTTDSNNLPYAKYTINVHSIDADCINEGILAIKRGGTERQDGLVRGLDHDLNIVLSGPVSSSISNNTNKKLKTDDVTIDYDIENITEDYPNPLYGNPVTYTLNTSLDLTSDNITGPLSKSLGGTGNSTGKAASAEKLDHNVILRVTGKVSNSSPYTITNFEKDANNDFCSVYIDISKISFGSSQLDSTKSNENDTNITGILPKKNGGTGNNIGNAPSSEKLDHNVVFSLSEKCVGSSSSNLSSNSVTIPITKINLGENDSTNITGILSTFNGGTGRNNGTISYADTAGTATLPKYFKIDLNSGTNNLASTQYFNGSTAKSSLSSGETGQTLMLNIGNNFPMSVHPNPETSGTGPFSRVYIDSKGHVRSGTYSKKTSFKTIPYSFDIFKGDNFIYKFTQNSEGIQNFGVNPGYMSFYTKPFTIFNDSNIYKNTNINISVNVIFNGLFYYPSGDEGREWIHYLDVLLFNEPDYNNFYNNIVNTGNSVNNDYLNLITGNNDSATSSTFLNNCYHLIGVENSTLSSCGMNLYDRLQNYYVNIYNDEMGVSFYSSVFNYSKSISLTNYISSGIDFSKAVYGIFKISTRCRNMSPATYNKNIARIFSTLDDSSVSYHPYYYPAHDYMYIDRPSTLKLSSPRIDFEYDSY